MLPVPISLEQVDGRHLQQIKIGDSLIRYRRKNNGVSSSHDSASTQFIIYHVDDLPDDLNIILIRPFGKEQRKEKYARAELLRGEWWFKGKEMAGNVGYNVIPWPGE